ncbi:hypothetical protein EYB33_19860 [Lysinibacillus sphaericus]|uniref:hypothetical protein n=1 Tax=Lysinibacillus sphaericus TaxID=1421 RepID=UPI001E2FFA65|nr:hypothetical protein [Lysinibacillus sphaericus]UDK98384.1 hypothetical protein EYB33_19860 [Lysinibacillus sphaericus]
MNKLILQEQSEMIKRANENANARVILDKFLYEMNKREIKYEEHEKELLKLTFHLWMIEQQIGIPVVVALPPSMGKSTALEVFAEFMAEHAPFFGMVVVKDEREQVIEYAHKVNSRVGRQVAYPFLGKTEEMTINEYRSQMDIQRYYPILVMTKAQFEIRSSMKDLERFAFWETTKGNVHRRSQLILDEPPVFEETFSFTPQKLTELLELVRQFSHKKNGKQESYYKEIQRKVIELRMILEDESYETGYFPAVDGSFMIPDRLKQDWLYKYQGDERNMLTAFEELVKRGGYKKQDKNTISMLVASYETHLQWTAFNPSILDGTGHIDKQYEKYNFPTISLEEKEGKYSHVKLMYYSSGGSFSKTSIKKKDGIEKIAGIVKEIVLKQKYQSTMVVIHSEFYDELKEKLDDFIRAGMIKLRWYNNGRSSNAYQYCDSAIFIGELNKGEQYYHAIAKLRYEDEDLQAGFLTGKGGNKFADERVREVYLNDTQVQRIQDMHRLRPRNRGDKLDFYFIGKNDELIEAVKEHFKGSKVEEYHTKKEGLSSTPAKEKFKLWLKEFANEPTGSKVKKKEVYTQILDCTSKTFQRIVKEDDIQDLADYLGVEFKGHSITKK